MLGRREDAHVAAGLGDDDFGGAAPDAGNRAPQLNRRRDRAKLRLDRAESSSIASSRKSMCARIRPTTSECSESKRLSSARDVTLVAWLRNAARAHVGSARMLFLLRFAQWPLRACLRPVLRRFPRDPSLLAFGAEQNHFAGNAAYLYLYMTRLPDVRCVWVTGSRTLAATL